MKGKGTRVTGCKVNGEATGRWRTEISNAGTADPQKKQQMQPPISDPGFIPLSSSRMCCDAGSCRTNLKTKKQSQDSGRRGWEIQEKPTAHTRDSSPCQGTHSSCLVSPRRLFFLPTQTRLFPAQIPLLEGTGMNTLSSVCPSAHG